MEVFVLQRYRVYVNYCPQGEVRLYHTYTKEIFLGTSKQEKMIQEKNSSIHGPPPVITSYNLFLTFNF